MKHPERPTVELPLGGRTYKLVFDFDAIATAEEETDTAIITGLMVGDVVKPKINFLRALFFSCAHAEQPDLTYEQAKALVTLKTFGTIWMKVLEAWKASNPAAEESDSGNVPTVQD